MKSDHTEQKNRHHRARTAPAPKVDLFVSGAVTPERILKLLAIVYERLQADILKHRKPTEDEDEQIYTALQNCFFSDGFSDAEGNRTTKRLTKRERLIRVVGACFYRVSFLDSNPADLTSDIELLDALKDLIEGYGTDEWTVTRECQIEFI